MLNTREVGVRGDETKSVEPTLGKEIHAVDHWRDINGVLPFGLFVAVGTLVLRLTPRRSPQRRPNPGAALGHPADQVEAFRRLADAGSTAAAIAARFGVSERTVEKRLRLGNAAPVLLEAYRAGEIDLETLMAFAVTTDQARQSAVWETVSHQGYRPGAWQIKRLLTEDRVPGS